MVERSKGFRSKTRKKLRKHVRKKGLTPISKVIQSFDVGERVHVVIDPGIHKGQPHPRFHGKTGKVLGNQGRAYLVEIRDGKMMKKIIVGPEHLKPQRG
ncbi:MAG: 50S ribosomal protein L21e [Candidatus Hydrothermarchaeota archaeon]